MPSSIEEAAIRAALVEYLRDPASLGLTTDLAALARTLVALPVYADMGAALLIRPTGEVLSVHSNQPWHESSEFEVVASVETRRSAWKSCAQRYPALRAIAERHHAGT